MKRFPSSMRLISYWMINIADKQCLNNNKIPITYRTALMASGLESSRLNLVFHISCASRGPQCNSIWKPPTTCQEALSTNFSLACTRKFQYHSYSIYKYNFRLYVVVKLQRKCFQALPHIQFYYTICICQARAEFVEQINQNFFHYSRYGSDSSGF